MLIPTRGDGEIKIGEIITGIPARYPWWARAWAWLRRVELPKTQSARITAIATGSGAAEEACPSLTGGPSSHLQA